jgi:hypothetical protein
MLNRNPQSRTGFQSVYSSTALHADKLAGSLSYFKTASNDGDYDRQEDSVLRNFRITVAKLAKAHAETEFEDTASLRTGCLKVIFIG